MWKGAVAGWDPPLTVTEDQYLDYKIHKPLGDPMTAYIGFAYSFAGKWYGGPARRANDKSKLQDSCITSTNRKINILRQNKKKLRISKTDFRACKIPDGAMVYLDPPYIGRTKRGSDVGFNDADYEVWARDLSARCTVIATDFKHRTRWTILHDYGDTVVRHQNSKGSDGTSELLMLVRR
jgi:DNA adenine methylase